MKKIKKIVEIIKNYINKEKNNKLGENLVIVIIIGIIIIIAGGTFFDGDKNKDEITSEKTQDDGAELVNSDALRDGKSELETNMEKVLSQISGAGKVTVMVTYVSGKELIPYYDTKRDDSSSDEKDSTGGTRKQIQSSFESNIAYEEVNNGVSKPIIVKEMFPQVKGVVVISEGVSDMEVKENLINAVKVLLDVPVHRIQVFERGRNN